MQDSNARERIYNGKVEESFIAQKIKKFMSENGSSEEAIRRLFDKANNEDFDNIFCREACIDLIYSTQIQGFNRDGIAVVAEHIKNLSASIDESIKKKEIDYELYGKLVDVTFSQGVEVNGELSDEEIVKTTIRRLYSFASKFLSFTLPEVYPIMDNKVKFLITFS